MRPAPVRRGRACEPVPPRSEHEADAELDVARIVGLRRRRPSPNAALVTLVFGAPNHGVLNRLNDSSRTCSRMRDGSAKVLNSEKSISPGRFVRTSSRRVVSVRSVKAGCTCHAIGSSADAQFWRAPLSACVQVLNQRAERRVLERRIADEERAGGRATGSPDWNVTMPFTCQPPSAPSSTPLRPLKNGSS